MSRSRRQPPMSGTTDFTSMTSNAPAAIKKTRKYPSFSAVAAQVVSARVYLGIHFRFADKAARTQGFQVAEYVHDHYLLPIAK